MNLAPNFHCKSSRTPVADWAWELSASVATVSEQDHASVVVAMSK